MFPSRFPHKRKHTESIASWAYTFDAMGWLSRVEYLSFICTSIYKESFLCFPVAMTIHYVPVTNGKAPEPR